MPDDMGDKSPIILTERKKSKLEAKAKEEMKHRFQWAIDSSQASPMFINFWQKYNISP